MLQTGKLDRRIAIERRVDTLDDHGQPIPTWSRIGKVRWGSVFPVDGTERFIAAEFVARQQTEFKVRWATDLADVNPKDRVVYPVSTSPANSDIYDIMAVHEIGRREGLKILAARRSDE